MTEKPETETWFLQLVNACGKAFPNKSKHNVQKEVSELWREMKRKQTTDTGLEEAVDEKLQEWKQVEMKRKEKLLSFWGKLLKSAEHKEQIRPSKNDKNDNVTASTTQDTEIIKEGADQDELPGSSKKQTGESTSTPKQDKIQAELSDVQDQVNMLYRIKDSGMLTDEERQELRSKEKEIDGLKKQLKKMKQNQERQKKFRKNFKRKIEELDEETKKKLKANLPSGRGQPPKFPDENLLHKAIIDIAIGDSAADERQCSEVIRTVKTLDDLTAALQNQGFNLSRSSVYLKLQPRNATTREGKRHVRTVPVKLIRS